MPLIETMQVIKVEILTFKKLWWVSASRRHSKLCSTIQGEASSQKTNVSKYKNRHSNILATNARAMHPMSIK